MNEFANIITLLCSCQPENIALAEVIAEGVGIDIPKLLEAEGFAELGLKNIYFFTPKLLEGYFNQMDISSLQAIKYFPNLTTLNCQLSYKKKLTSLAGIEYLTNLQNLSCDWNQINNIDALQRLTKLQILDCSYNEINNLNALKNSTNLITNMNEKTHSFFICVIIKAKLKFFIKKYLTQYF